LSFLNGASGFSPISSLSFSDISTSLQSLGTKVQKEDRRIPTAIPDRVVALVTFEARLLHISQAQALWLMSCVRLSLQVFDQEG
jgi:hypothetical protein